MGGEKFGGEDVEGISEIGPRSLDVEQDLNASVRNIPQTVTIAIEVGSEAVYPDVVQPSRSGPPRVPLLYCSTVVCLLASA